MTIRCPYCGDENQHQDVYPCDISDMAGFYSMRILTCEVCGRDFEFHDVEDLVGIECCEHRMPDPTDANPSSQNQACPYCGCIAFPSDRDWMDTEHTSDEDFVKEYSCRCRTTGGLYYQYE